jgi:DNA-binding NarL/FixJ family response regulator
MIRVLIVDDHPAMRSGLDQLLSGADGMEVVGTAADGSEAVELARSGVDVVLMDLSMAGMDGVEATRRIRADDPDVRVVVLTSFAEQERIFAALDAGASGYLLKDAEPDELLRGVRAAAVGESPFSPKAAQALVSMRQQHRSAEQLTPREREVLALLAQGLTNKVIARRLGIAEKTVKTHLTSVFSAIGVSDRTQAALWAARNGVA